MRRLLLLLVIVGSGCSSPTSPDGGPVRDGATDSSGGLCTAHRDCDDGVFCNGEERCEPGASGAGHGGCVAGTAPCAPSERCNDESDRCELSECPADPSLRDADGDGHELVVCGGDDCDDDDADRYPGNPERCDAEGHDEDCDPSTLGAVDADGDGAISAGCCNGATCGPDCDDDNPLILPGATEQCNGVDDDCDGAIDGDGAFCPVGICMTRRCRAPTWERVYSPSLTVHSLAHDAAGNLYAVVDLNGPGDLDDDRGNPLQTAGAHLLSLSPSGETRWVQRVGDAAVGGVGAMAIDPSGVRVAYGAFYGGCASEVPIQIRSAMDGALVDTHTIPAASTGCTRGAHRLHWLASGLVAVIAVQPFFVTGGNAAPYFVLLDGTGAVVTSRLVSGVTSLGGTGIAPDESVVWTGQVPADTDVGSGPLRAGTIVSALDGALGHRWTFELADAGSTGSIGVWGVSIGGGGDMALCGSYGGAVSVRGETWPASVLRDAYVLVLDASGARRWSFRHSGPGDDELTAVSYDPRGGLVVAGTFSGTLDLTPFGSWMAGTTATERDGVLAVFRERDGWPLDGRRLEGEGTPLFAGVAIDPFGAYLAAGSFTGRTDLFRGEYTAAAGGSAFVARVSE